jgi:putative transposase
MPRQARVDVPGTLHHVILRGLERGQIVADRQDWESFLARFGLSLAEVARQLGVSTSGIAKAVSRAEQPEVH